MNEAASSLRSFEKFTTLDYFFESENHESPRDQPTLTHSHITQACFWLGGVNLEKKKNEATLFRRNLKRTFFFCKLYYFESSFQPKLALEIGIARDLLFLNNNFTKCYFSELLNSPKVETPSVGSLRIRMKRVRPTEFRQINVTEKKKIKTQIPL